MVVVFERVRLSVLWQNKLPSSEGHHEIWSRQQDDQVTELGTKFAPHVHRVPREFEDVLPKLVLGLFDLSVRAETDRIPESRAGETVRSSSKNTCLPSTD